VYAVSESDECLGDPLQNDPQRLHYPSNALFFLALVFPRYKRRTEHSKRVKNGFLSCERACRLYSFLLSHCATLLAHALGLEAAPQPHKQLLLCASKRKGRGPGVLLAAFSFYWALDPLKRPSGTRRQCQTSSERSLFLSLLLSFSPSPNPILLPFSPDRSIGRALNARRFALGRQNICSLHASAYAQ